MTPLIKTACSNVGGIFIKAKRKLLGDNNSLTILSNNKSLSNNFSNNKCSSDNVSSIDNHPNEECQSLFAEIFLTEYRKLYG